MPNHAYVATATPGAGRRGDQSPLRSQCRTLRDRTRLAGLRSPPAMISMARPQRHEQGICGSPDASVRTQVLTWLEQNDVSIEGEGGWRIRLILPDDSDLKRPISTLPGVLSMVEHVTITGLRIHGRDQHGLSTRGRMCRARPPVLCRQEGHLTERSTAQGDAGKWRVGLSHKFQG